MQAKTQQSKPSSEPQALDNGAIDLGEDLSTEIFAIIAQLGDFYQYQRAEHRRKGLILRENGYAPVPFAVLRRCSQIATTIQEHVPAAPAANERGE